MGFNTGEVTQVLENEIVPWDNAFAAPLLLMFRFSAIGSFSGLDLYTGHRPGARGGDSAGLGVGASDSSNARRLRCGSHATCSQTCCRAATRPAGQQGADQAENHHCARHRVHRSDSRSSYRPPHQRSFGQASTAAITRQIAW